MPHFSDQLGRVIYLPEKPNRIISLVPSQTELLYDLGLSTEVVGITKFCIHPSKWCRSKIKVGGTKSLKLEIIRQLQPQLIIANKEENVKEQIEIIATEYPVWVSDVSNLNEALKMITLLGQVVEKEVKAHTLIDRIQTEFAGLQKGKYRPKACYLIWREPFMTIGGDTFIHDMLHYAGFENLFAHRLRYPELSLAELQRLEPEYLLLSSEPYPFKEKHIHELKPYFPATTIKLVNGELFSWYGSRLLRASEYFMHIRNEIME